MDMTIQRQERFYRTDAEGREICSAVVQERHSALWVGELWVHPDHRQHGLGTALMEAVIRARGHQKLYLFVSGYADRPLSDQQLQQWYATFGFEVVGSIAPGLMVRRTSEILEGR